MARRLVRNKVYLNTMASCGYVTQKLGEDARPRKDAAAQQVTRGP
jgi:hypothetical protein